MVAANRILAEIYLEASLALAKAQRRAMKMSKITGFPALLAVATLLETPNKPVKKCVRGGSDGIEASR